MFREALTLLRRPWTDKARTLQMRAFAFFTLFAVAIVGAGILILAMIGVFRTTEQRHLAWMDAEARHVSAAVAEDYASLSMRGVSLARTLADGIHDWAEDQAIAGSQVTAHPELVDALLSQTVGDLLTVLDNTVSSGAFIILDASTSPVSDNPDTKAGLFLKRTTTNSLSSVPSKTYCLRGPADVARANGIELLGQWRRDFDLGGMRLFDKVMTVARSSAGTDLSRLYYWSDRYLLDGNSEYAMLLLVPLIAPDGTVWGLCGMEVSDMLFKRLYSPDATHYPRVLAAFAPTNAGEIDTRVGLIAGNFYLSSQTVGLLTPQAGGGAIDLLASDDKVYAGRAEGIKLYPSDSPFRAEGWAVALLLPKSDWDRGINHDKLLFYGGLIAVLAASLFAALFISRRYIRPVVSALSLVRSQGSTSAAKTQIAEIDDLLEYLAALDQERKALGVENQSLSAELEQTKAQASRRDGTARSPLFERFLRNLGSLSTQERAVFNLYMENRTAHEIAAQLFISINTVKFHNKNIYGKLGVSSLEALKVYVALMKET
ncbi:MAG: helix-turn-helix transcriptional regulator [Propionibacteriaceae bacterium]|jgi:DNA-binding CsgD family transcriptional regulator|nr:helix-turn-helix transcriptional regulator [Propionibacteriaceae bacterium]